MNQLSEDFTKLDLSKTDHLLCELAKKLTETPNYEGKAELIQALKIEGLSDRAILDATLVIGYFNFVNRIVLGLGVNLEADDGKGYNYD